MGVPEEKLKCSEFTEVVMVTQPALDQVSCSPTVSCDTTEKTRWPFLKTGSLISKDDGDGNENGKKAIGLDWQNNNFASTSRFFVHFFNVAARLQRESA